MAKPPKATSDTAALVVRERMLLFCVGSGTHWQRAGVTGGTVTALIVRVFSYGTARGSSL